MASVSTPRVKVTLTKTMAREQGLSERFKGQNRVWDLTQWLGENGVVRTNKTLHDPAGGFTLAFPDKPDYALADTLYGLVEPMDVVEIRMGRGPGELPIVMRGFVQRIARSEAMGNDGAPQRMVLVQGHDYGAVFRWINIIWNKAFLEANEGPGGNPLFSQYKLQAATSEGQPISFQRSGEFVRSLVDNMVNRWLRNLDAMKKDNAVLEMGADVGQGLDGNIAPMSVGSLEGDLWNMIQTVGDLDWNEFFVEDRADKPWVVYRPAPWKDAYSGKLIMPGAKDPGTINIGSEDLRRSQLSHGAEKVANWYWVDAQTDFINPATLSNDALLRGAALVTDENCDEALFGLRVRRAMTLQFPSLANEYPVNDPQEQRDAWSAILQDWRGYRRDQLIAMHKDNVVFEDGSFTLKGNPDLQIGKYLHLTRGSFAGDYYMVGVDHAFSPFQDWATNVRVERGTGFINRMKEGRSPVWMEGRPGAYDKVAPTAPSPAAPKQPSVTVDPVESAG